ncbi:hypothetical protein QBC47DRAFT_143268 [Echria macrotheca]|uniref:Uncharacterized protein n=1 Tax=Echria macrotheca TaxID=438768 RepID=A0AAJ0BHQ3_9PEZI|nr:hypothetical protein QBC47DRAFT_143268 [Echria macrotheca]
MPAVDSGPAVERLECLSIGAMLLACLLLAETTAERRLLKVSQLSAEVKRSAESSLRTRGRETGPADIQSGGRPCRPHPCRAMPQWTQASQLPTRTRPGLGSANSSGREPPFAERAHNHHRHSGRRFDGRRAWPPPTRTLSRELLQFA